jgi:hypothetical protein
MNIVKSAFAVALCAAFGLGLFLSPVAAGETQTVVRTIKSGHGTRTIKTDRTSHDQTTRDVHKKK